jgi:hypothetical protein
MIKKAAFISLFIAVSMITSLPSAHAAYFVQVNRDGFGSSHNAGNLEVKTMAVFKNKLYVGVANQVDGAQVFCFDGTTWQRASESGFGMRDNIAITVALPTSGAIRQHPQQCDQLHGLLSWLTLCGAVGPALLKADRGLGF